MPTLLPVALLLAPGLALAPTPALAGTQASTTTRVPVTLPQTQAGPAAQPASTMVAAPIALAIAGFDADGDGRTSRAEMIAGVARSFAAVDTAHRGALRYLDYADWALRWLGDRNALPSPFELDSDGDDAVSLPELQAGFAAAFDRLDADRDGYLTRAELLTILAGRTGDDRGRRGGKRTAR
jgi:hypothetical protein